MNKNNGDYLFKVGADDKNVYILQKGSYRIYLKSQEEDKEFPLFPINESGIIMGIVESILNIKRLTSLKVTSDTGEFMPIPLGGKNILETVFNNPKLGLQLSINLALFLKETNSKLTELSKTLNGIRATTNELCLNFYECCESISELNEKFKFPWLKAIYDQAKQNLIYKYGLSAKSGKDVLEEMVEMKKNELKVEKENIENAASKVYKAGEVLCNEGEIGKEMYILLDGELSVWVNNNKVAEITKKGEIIGEIAVLLGIKTKTFEKRTATLKIKKDAKIVSMPSDKIVDIICRDPKIIVHTIKTLAERSPESCSKVADMYEKMDKAVSLMNPRASTSSTCPKAFMQLQSLIEQKANDKEKVKDILNRLYSLIEKSKEEYNKHSTVYETLLQ